MPLLPVTLTGYLEAPMPFLMGMPAAMLANTTWPRSVRLESFVVIDLDLKTCAPGKDGDAALLLPWRDKLAAALAAAVAGLKSPTEHESDPLIAGVVQVRSAFSLGLLRTVCKGWCTLGCVWFPSLDFVMYRLGRLLHHGFVPSVYWQALPDLFPSVILRAGHASRSSCLMMFSLC